MSDHDLRAVAFPTLDDAQIDALGRCADASLKQYSAGSTLFDAGDTDFAFFVVQSGEVEIVDRSGDAPRTFAVHRRGEFTGDVAHLAGGPAIVSAIAKTDCTVYVVSAIALQQILNQCPDVGDVILQAFIARRQLLRESGSFMGVRVIGSRYSRDTFRIRDFLAKNRMPFTWLDLEADPRSIAYYAATPNEAQLCSGADVVLVGGGNSAGQAAVYLAAHTRKVYLVVRGDDLEQSMSAYLARRIQQIPEIEILLHSQVRRILSDSTVRSVEVVDCRTGQVRKLEVVALFSFIGAAPRTDWLPAEIEKNAKGFVATGAALAPFAHWSGRRQPHLLETSRPGAFAAGDARSDSVKRVASAVGEGAMAVRFVHEYLKER
jgi:CRP-like cAMP-binding protein